MLILWMTYTTTVEMPPPLHRAALLSPPQTEPRLLLPPPGWFWCWPPRRAVSALWWLLAGTARKVRPGSGVGCTVVLPPRLPLLLPQLPGCCLASVRQSVCMLIIYLVYSTKSQSYTVKYRGEYPYTYKYP